MRIIFRILAIIGALAIAKILSLPGEMANHAVVGWLTDIVSKVLSDKLHITPSGIRVGRSQGVAPVTLSRGNFSFLSVSKSLYPLCPSGKKLGYCQAAVGNLENI
jgi:hypothetical protein